MRNPLATIAGTLRDARGLLEKHGWIQYQNNAGGYATNYHGLCIHDAIVNCKGGRRYDALMVILSIIKGRTSIELVTWNDYRGRTVEQAFALVDRAIGIAEKMDARDARRAT